MNGGGQGRVECDPPMRERPMTGWTSWTSWADPCPASVRPTPTPPSQKRNGRRIQTLLVLRADSSARSCNGNRPRNAERWFSYLFSVPLLSVLGGLPRFCRIDRENGQAAPGGSPGRMLWCLVLFNVEAMQ